MSFHQQSFNSRFASMGDEAEAVYDAIFPKSIPFGLNRPPFSMTGMTEEMKATPDRMERLCFVECQGFGRDQILKLKPHKLNALTVWAEHIGPVDFFAWNRTEKLWYRSPLYMWRNAAARDGVLDNYHDGPAYLGLPVERFPTEGHPLPDHVEL